MATSPCSQPMSCFFISTQKQGSSCSINLCCHKILTGGKFCFLKVKASTSKSSSNDEPSTKPNSVLCADCNGKGAVLCSQCKGNGVNSIDHFNGQFKAGESCWLCGGKKDILCGNCNGAGFIGGFMTSSDT